ncbi:hypothetical protein BKA69DRAFT_1127650 [Paraphysoderma sedebokerense]|nr:hypothetical protein BKA69DRAFT_1127650 [Paraphysoderma sedebokerense]
MRSTANINTGFPATSSIKTQLQQPSLIDYIIKVHHKHLSVTTMNVKSILILCALLALTSVVSARPVEAIADAGPGESVEVINNNGKITTSRGGTGQGAQRGARKEGTKNSRTPAANTPKKGGKPDPFFGNDDFFNDP